MDQDALVTERVEAGKRFLAQLSAVGFPIAVAFWARPSDEQWFLYLASPVVDEKGGHEAYRDLTLHERRFDNVGLDPFEVRLVSPSDTMAVAAAKLIEPKPWQPKPSPFMTRFDGSRLGGIDVEGVLVYPALAPTVPGA
ncbi:hypothetical protein R5W23_000444 [Gemmata sp. JC673]|uniref:Uncharacterized protein n=1 Tax=Gemmata algarum TaxID=2975278 RepID=A0ABU5F0J9_9BACT|nr:hypothetical protein [Gemmata algarum]MDY3559451.1 hypothetical protein [Gemmata algarum]